MAREPNAELRVHRRSHFTIIPNETARDQTLSFRARGVLAWMLSHEDGFTLTAAAVWRAAGPRHEGRDAVRNALQELETAGYYHRERCQDNQGRWQLLAHVYERPGRDQDGFPGPGQPTPGIPAVNTEDQLEETKAEANASTGFDPEHPPCLEDAPLLDAKTARGEVASSVTRAYWDWVKRTTGHEPPENYNAIRAMVDRALAADFTVAAIKGGLVTIQENRPRPITRQTLWDAMGKAQRPSKRTSGTNDWIEGVEALHAEIEAGWAALNAEGGVATDEGATKDTP